MIVIDEYLAVRVLGGEWPAELPNDELVLPTSRHWRLFQLVLFGTTARMEVLR